MIRYLWVFQFFIILFILLVLLIICFITDLPRVLGFSFSKKETISKYIKKYMRKDRKLKRVLCNFKMIGSKSYKNMDEVYIYMYIAQYSFKKNKLTLLYEEYSKAKVILTRSFGIYKVISFQMEDPKNKTGKDFYPDFITSSPNYDEYINPKVNRFLKEANLKKANKKLRLRLQRHKNSRVN